VPDRTPSPAEEARHLHACLFHVPLDEVVIARYEAALRAGQANACPTSVARVVARRLDAEAVEFALRRRGLGGDLAGRMRILCYLVEVRPEYLSQFVNLAVSPAGSGSVRAAWAALLTSTLRSGWKRIKGEYLVRRHGLV
jgi:hypothetical protein